MNPSLIGTGAGIFSVRDVAATVEATFLIEGPRSGLQSLLRWTPRVVALRAANIFVPRLLARGRVDLVTPLLEDPSIPSLFKALVAVPLARAGHLVGAETFRQILEDPRLPRLLQMKKMHFGYQREDQYDFADTFTCACELSVKHWADQPFFTAVLDRLAAAESWRTARLYDHDTDLLDIMVRAYCLSCSIKGREPEVSDFLGPKVEKDSEADEHDRRRDESLRTMIAMLIGFFSVRAKHFLSGSGSETTLKELREAVRSIRSNEYRISMHARGRLFEVLSLNLFDLSALPNADAAAVLQVAESVFGDKVSPTGYQLLPLFRRTSTNGKTQAIVLKWVSERDNSIGALQTSASEKSDAFIALARLTAPVSEKDGRVLFAHAHEATGEIDADARFQLRALSALLERATSSLSAEGVARPELVRHRNRFCVSIGAQQGKEASGPRSGAESNDQAGVREARNRGRWLAYLPALGGEHVGRYGRASVHHPRLPAPQQPQRHEPILAGDIEDQASRSGQTGRSDPAQRISVCKQVPPDSVNSPKKDTVRRSATIYKRCLFGSGSAYWTLMDPDFQKGFWATH
jgi:hypothetical protein